MSTKLLRLQKAFDAACDFLKETLGKAPGGTKSWQEWWLKMADEDGGSEENDHKDDLDGTGTGGCGLHCTPGRCCREEE